MNMDDAEGAEGSQPKSLGKLQFSLDYDFQKGEVLDTAVNNTSYRTNASVVVIIKCVVSKLY